MSKIDARYGAFGIIPEDLDGAIITGNFWTYKLDENKINAEWFFYFTQSFDFIQICKEASTGTTHRKYLDEKVFLAHKIHLPSKEVQQNIVKDYKLRLIKERDLLSEINKQESFI